MEAAYKAHEYRRAQFGPFEQSRACGQSGWTRAHPRIDKAQNPWLRGKYYSAADLLRAGLFVLWRMENPDISHAENPYSWENRELI